MSATSGRNDAGTGGTDDSNLKRPAASVSSAGREFSSEKKRRVQLAEMSPASRKNYNVLKTTKAKQGFRNQYEETAKLKKITTTKTDAREETHSDFSAGLYISRSRIYEKEGGFNPTSEDIDAGDKHILHCAKQGGRWLMRLVVWKPHAIPTWHSSPQPNPKTQHPLELLSDSDCFRVCRRIVSEYFSVDSTYVFGCVLFLMCPRKRYPHASPFARVSS